MKTINLLSLLFSFLLVSIATNAIEIDSTKAKNIAAAYCFHSFPEAGKLSLELISPSIAQTFANTKGEPLLYFINVKPRGYLVVSADDRAYPVLSYSQDETWSGEYWDALPPAANDMLQGYADQMEILINSNLTASPEVTSIWEKYSNSKNLEPKTTTYSNEVVAIGNLSWGQGQYYNAQCPQTGGSHPIGDVSYDNRCPAGCVAIAISQIMRYWEWPAKGMGSNSYNDPENATDCSLPDPSYGNQDADFKNTTYNWKSMPGSLTGHNAEVAQIIRHSGIAVNMDYSYCTSGSNATRARDALVDYFNFSDDAAVESKDALISWDSWERMIRAEINAQRPLYYRGSRANGGGHALVCYAFKYADTYHLFKFNWGWNGSNNGTWYTIRSITGETLITYHIDQSIITGIYPNATNLPIQPCPGMPTISFEGNTYNNIKIGNQCWMKENLNLGQMIQGNQSSSNNSITEKYCYGNVEANCAQYGALYSWDELMNYSDEEGSRGICPEDYHIPTDDDWNKLSGFNDSQYPANDPIWETTGWRGSDGGGKLKEVGTNLWQSPNTMANNKSAFTGLPGGLCSSYGSFSGIAKYSYFWTSSKANSYSSYYHRLDYNAGTIYRTTRMLGYKLGVRCVYDEEFDDYAELSGDVMEFNSYYGIEGAQVTLSNQANSFETTTNELGGYSFEYLPLGTYNITVKKEGFETQNRIVELNYAFTFVSDFELFPGSENSLRINNHLSAYADLIEENPMNVFTLSGSVRINDILEFDGNIIIDKRPSLAHPEVKGNCGFFAAEIKDIGDYWIKDNNIAFKYYAEEGSLLPLTTGYLLDGTFLIGGFNITIGELTIASDGDFIEVKSIAKMPFPIDKVVDNLLEEYANNLPFFVKKMAGSRILSKSNGKQTSVDIDGISANIGIVSLEDVHLYFNTNEQLYGGGFTLNIPGNIKKPKDVIDASLLPDNLDSLRVEIVDENNQVIDSLSFNEFIDSFEEKGFKLLSVGAEIEFSHGKINKLIISIGTKIPLGPTGLFITELTGGVEDLATKDWRIIANVDISVGVEVPILGSPVKLNDFGVSIQPMNYFQGSGEFQIFDQTVSDGYIEYNRPKGSLLAECNLNLNGVVKGHTELSLVGGQIRGSGLLGVQTPEDLDWPLNWAQNKNVGSARIDLYNDIIQSEIELRWISLAQRMKFGKNGFPWFHYYIGKNLNLLIKVWKGDIDGKQAIVFQVPENTGQLLVIAGDTINSTPFDFSIQNPSGQIFDYSNSLHYEKNVENNQTIMSVLKPLEGDWYFLTEYEGDIVLETMGLNQQPTTLTDAPQTDRTRSNQISLSFNDYSDTLNVQVYYDDDKKDFNGRLIDEFNVVNNGNLEFTWQNDDVPNGEYYIYCRVEDNYNAPILQYAPGSILVENDVNIESPQGFSAIQNGESVNTSWDRPTLENIVATTVFFKNISTGRTNEATVFGEYSTDLRGLEAGNEYKIWSCFINDNGTYSQASNIENLIFTSNTRNNPPYFTLNPESNFEFIVDEESQFTLTANDADGDALVFEAPENSLGIIISDDIITWTPSDNQKGVHNLMLTVSDGSQTDTTFQQLIVFTQEQVSTSIKFSSVNLYESDNMYVKIKNYHCKNEYEQVVLQNTRTLEETPVDCRKVDQFSFIGQFNLSINKKSDINVSNGDTLEVKYMYNGNEYLAYSYYNSEPQPSDLTAPGVIDDIQIESLTNNQLLIKWTASGNDDTEGKAYRYDIRYSFEPIISEDVYFTAYLIENSPYPSVSGIQDSLILNLVDLNEVYFNDSIYFSIKAEDEMQNRGALSNSPGINCLPVPQNISTRIVEATKIQIDWSGPTAAQKEETGFDSYNLFRKVDNGPLYIYQTDIETPGFTDDLFYQEDGTFQYAVQAVYRNSTSDSILSEPIEIKRFTDITMLCSLEDSTNYSGISFEMIGLDTLYTQSYEITTNSTGLILLNKVFKTNYAIEISFEGYESITDTIIISDQNTSFNFTLLNPVRTMQLNLPEGWSGISTPINLYDNSIENAFNDILSDLIILQNPDGDIYWPAQNINTILNWVTSDGYQIKLSNAASLTISGTRGQNKTLQLNAGWNLIPVPSECDVTIHNLFNIPELVLIKEVAGWNLYWPAFGINTLGKLEAGKAYFVFMNADALITFPDCTYLKSNLNQTNNQTIPDFLKPSKTPITHIIALPEQTTSTIENGSYIIASDELGKMYGVSPINGQNTTITLFGDDPLTENKDGFYNNENLFFKVLTNNQSKDVVFYIEDKPIDYEARFQSNGISVVSEIKFLSSNIQPQQLNEKISIYPNPAKNEIIISSRNNSIITGAVFIYNSQGVLLKAIYDFLNDQKISLEDFKSGVYILRLETGSEIITKRLIIE